MTTLLAWPSSLFSPKKPNIYHFISISLVFCIFCLLVVERNAVAQAPTRLGGTTAASVANSATSAATSAKAAHKYAKKCASSGWFGGLMDCTLAVASGYQTYSSLKSLTQASAAQRAAQCRNQACPPALNLPKIVWPQEGGGASPNTLKETVPSKQDPPLTRFVKQTKQQADRAFQVAHQNGVVPENEQRYRLPDGRTVDMGGVGTGRSGLSPQEETAMSNRLKEMAQELAQEKRVITQQVSHALSESVLTPSGGLNAGLSFNGVENPSALDFGKSLRSLLHPSPASPLQEQHLTKPYGLQPIGVSSDSLFGMISRRYKKLQEKSLFLPKVERSLSNRPNLKNRWWKKQNKTAR